MLTPLKILLIEDDTIELMKFRRVLSRFQVQHQVIEANNGEEALKILEKKDEVPSIILLDLNMPKVNGIEFLTELKNNNELKYIPVVVLTTSGNYKDLKHCYEIGIAGYILKPLKLEEYTLKMEMLLDYWSINNLIIK